MRRGAGGWFLLGLIGVLFFSCYTKDLNEKKDQCGNPITEHTQIECGVLQSMVDHCGTFITEDNNIWEVEIGDPTQFNTSYYYCLFIDTKGTNDTHDDEVLKIWKEIW